MFRKPLTSHRLQEALKPVRDEVSASGPEELQTALDQFIDVFTRVEAEKSTAGGLSLAPNEITELGEYGTGLLLSLLRALEKSGNESLHRIELMTLTIDLALWISRNNGELVTLEPVVDGLAFFANNTSDTAYLEDLHGIANEIVRGTAHTLRQDIEKSDPGRPWRILNINKAIMATRTHNADLIEQAFQDLITNLPEEAPQFFREGMEQMDALDYPAHVRKVMERYYQLWNTRSSLH